MLELVRIDNKQALLDRDQPSLKPFYIDFVHGALDYRRRHGGGVKQSLAKAIGLQKNQRPLVWDATAGLGRDAFVLASLGCTVVLFERSPIIHALLEDAIIRAEQDKDVAPIINKMRLVLGDAIATFNNTTKQDAPDVIYLDPMFPPRKKSALVKKEMRLIKQVVGLDSDSAKLLAPAMALAKRRVVVKRPSDASFLANLKPSYSLKGKSNRYDIYLSHPNKTPS